MELLPGRVQPAVPTGELRRLPPPQNHPPGRHAAGPSAREFHAPGQASPQPRKISFKVADGR